LLSNAITDFVKANQHLPAATLQSNTNYYGLLVTDVGAHAQLLQSYMAPFAGDYQIKWIEADVLIVFTDPAAMRTALFVLAGGPFQVREYKEKIEIEGISHFLRTYIDFL
jgi:hypothetical protein